MIFRQFDERKFQKIMETWGTGCYNGSQSRILFIIYKGGRAA